MGDPQQTQSRTAPSPGPKKSPFVGGNAKTELNRAPTSPNLSPGGGKKAPPPLPKRPADDSGTPSAAPQNAGPPKVPPRNATVANIQAKPIPRVAEPIVEPDSPPPTAVVPDGASPPIQSSPDFEPKPSVKSNPSFRDTIALPSQSAILNTASSNGAAPPGTPGYISVDSNKALETALAEPLFRKVEVIISLMSF
jgi:hypothetical protein